jgi:nucleotide-binding universal stress UspA family protein
MSSAYGLGVLAREVGAGIVVVGSTHRGALGRVAPGTMADRLLSGSVTAVAVAPRGFAEDAASMREVGVGFDGSAEPEMALAFAAAIAEDAHARLVVLQAIEPVVEPPVFPGPDPTLAAEPVASLAGRREAAERRLTETLRRISPKVTVEGAVEGGRADEVLIAASEKLDLLVLGSRAYGPVRRVLLGSTSARVSRGAGCPLLIVPRGDAEEERHRVLRATGETAVGLVPLTGP